MSFALVASFLPDIVPPQALTGGRGICLGCRRSCGSSVRSRGGPSACRRSWHPPPGARGGWRSA